MNRVALVRLVLRSYPVEVRTATDQEIVATMLDACEGSSAALVVQLGSVLRGGLVSRVRLAAQQPLRRLVTEGAGAGAMLLLAWTLANLVHRWPPQWGHGLWPVDLMFAPVLWAVGLRRIAGLVALLALATHGLAIGWSLGREDTVGWSDPYGIAGMLAGSLMLVAIPSRPRPTIIGRLSGLILLVLTSALFVAAFDSDPMILPWVLCGTLALVTLPFAPGLALGLGVFCLSYALESSFGQVFTPPLWSARVLLQWCVLPATLLVIAGARHRARALA